MATHSTLHQNLADRAKDITRRELQSYSERTKRSQTATERARKVLPLGVPSSFQAYDPHPIVVARSWDAYMEDVDGNRYVDYDMGFGALFAGHMHPAVRRAVEGQLDLGTLFVTPCETNAVVAELPAAGESLILCGDLNVARTDMDVHPKERRRGIGQLPEERALLERMLSRGLVDVHRTMEPDNPDLFTWWAPWRNMRERNIGWRLDYVLASKALADRTVSCLVQRQTGTSDHGPVIAEFA